MSWNAVIDQRRVIESLRSNISSDRIAHAYLFQGPDGVGKRAVALEFGKTLLCARGGDEACDECLPCQKVDRMVHPDLHVLFPYPTDVSTEDVAARLQLLAANPYAAVDFVRRPSLQDPSKSSNRQATYTVDRMHQEVQRSMSFKPVEGRYKIAVLTDVDRMNIESATAFLKLLEEPPDRTIFVLTTSRPDVLLPTILSRCRRIRFDLLTAEAIEESLVGREDVEPRLAATLARMADGSYAGALDLKENEDLMGLRRLVVDYFRYSYANNIDKLADLIEETGRLGRENVKGVLDLMLRWVRDLVLYNAMGSEAPIVNIDQQETIANFSSNLPDADLEAMASLVEEAMDLIERNVHVNLTLTVLSHTLGRAMRGPHSGRLYIPLSEPGLSRTG